MNTLKKIVENYLLNFNQKYMFIDKETKYTKKLILKKIEFYKEDFLKIGKTNLIKEWRFY